MMPFCRLTFIFMRRYHDLMTRTNMASILKIMGPAAGPDWTSMLRPHCGKVQSVLSHRSTALRGKDHILIRGKPLKVRLLIGFAHQGHPPLAGFSVGPSEQVCNPV